MSKIRRKENEQPGDREPAAGVLGVAGLTSRRIPQPADNVKRYNKPIFVVHYGTIVRYSPSWGVGYWGA